MWLISQEFVCYLSLGFLFVYDKNFVHPYKLFDQYVYRVYQNDWSGFEVDYIHKYGEQNYKY